MNDKVTISIWQFLEAAIIFADQRCPRCKRGKLKLTVIGDGVNVITHWIACEKCETEFAFSYAFVPATNIPEGR